jgi:hypothetical protein
MRRFSSDDALRLRPEADLVSGRIVAAKVLGGASVIGEAADAAARLREVDPDFRVWCTVSAPEAGDIVRRTRFRGAVRGLGVEIAEDAAMRDVPETLRAFGALRDAGLAIALDDFGSDLALRPGPAWASRPARASASASLRVRGSGPASADGSGERSSCRSRRCCTQTSKRGGRPPRSGERGRSAG